MAPFVIQWGIIGCGSISGSFVRDLTLSTSERDAGDVAHAVAAVGSRDVTKAEKFIKDNCPQGGSAQKEGLSDLKPSPKGSYKECVEDPNVQAVYIGTPHMAHYDDCKLTLEAGKHCLLEKPATLNAAEWKSLSELAKSKKLFLMEAVWTRFNPNMIYLQKALHEDEVIGDVTALHTNLSLNAIGRRPDSDRVIAAELAGGALLDLGPYPWTWSMMLLYHHPKNKQAAPEHVNATMLKYPKTGVDLDTLWGMTFPNLPAMAHCTASLMAPVVPGSICRVIGTKGEIDVTGHTSRPNGFIVRKYKDPSDENSAFLPDEVHENDFKAHGLAYEADAFARCLRDGLLECPRMPHSETLLMMQTFDKIREQGGYKYPKGLERIPL